MRRIIANIILIFIVCVASVAPFHHHDCEGTPHSALLAIFDHHDHGDCDHHQTHDCGEKCPCEAAFAELVACDSADQHAVVEAPSKILHPDAITMSTTDFLASTFSDYDSPALAIFTLEGHINLLKFRGPPALV